MDSSAAAGGCAAADRWGVGEPCMMPGRLCSPDKELLENCRIICPGREGWRAPVTAA
ncbi:hypothetical protein T261_5225 [Streptomyces lydicus]|nr:hypothetical protein T261_5225 [Streptomyces lydicus]